MFLNRVLNLVQKYNNNLKPQNYLQINFQKMLILLKYLYYIKYLHSKLMIVKVL